MVTILISEKAEESLKTKCCAEAKKRSEADGYAKAICDHCGVEYLKYYSAKAKICCSCREKKRLLNHGSAVKQQAGFPKEPGYFKTYEEIESYYISDELVCLLCGNGFVSLPAHLSAIHNIDADRYKEIFGLPLSRGLVTDEFHESRSEDCKRREIGKDMEFMHKMAKAEKPKHRSMNACLREHTIAMLSKALRGKVKGNPNHIINRKNIVPAFCSKCGGKIDREITEHALLVQGCRILCKKCKREGYLASQKRYMEKKRNKG
ncbi:MAG: MucR family transcriptional regulator [Anaerolineaceae bacterium]|nr:MucR family transcriptional regulator [Anaerolineaceae bacterium]